MWECGLKQLGPNPFLDERRVTPYVGVWIETTHPFLQTDNHGVTPYVGVWIETGVRL